MPPKKNVFTLTELVLLSIVWSSTQFVWSNILKQSLAYAFGAKLGLGKNATDAAVAVFLLAFLFAMIFLFSNVDVGRTSVFQLTDEEPLFQLPFQAGDASAPAAPEIPVGIAQGW